MRVCVLAAALLAFGLLAATLPVTAEEDAFIYYRYAWHWAHGQGLAFNPGEPVEGFSSPLWMGVLALVAWSGLDLPVTAPLLGLACGAAILVATWWLGAVVGLSAWGRAAVLAALAVSTPFVTWARSGLETPFYSLAVVTAVAAYLAAEYPAAAGPRAPRWLGALGLIAVCLGRPEGPLLAAVIVGDRLLDGRDSKGALRYGLPALAAYAGLLAWRSHVFDSLVPNTAVKLYTPLVGRSASQAAGYAAYLGVLPAVLPALALRRPRAGRRRLGVLVAAVLLSFFFHVLAGGDYRPGFRYLIPTLPLALVAIWCAFERLPLASRPAARIGLLLLVLAGPAVLLIQNPPSVRAWRERVVSPWLDPYSEHGHWGVQIARWVEANVKAGGVVAFGQMGRVPYFAARHGHDVRFVDTMGLVDGEISRIFRPPAKLAAFWRDLRRDGSPGRALEAGRRERSQRVAASILARRPDFILLETAWTDRRTEAVLASPDFQASYRKLTTPDAPTGVEIYARVTK